MGLKNFKLCQLKKYIAIFSINCISFGMVFLIQNFGVIGNPA